LFYCGGAKIIQHLDKDFFYFGYGCMNANTLLLFVRLDSVIGLSFSVIGLTVLMVGLSVKAPISDLIVRQIRP